MNFYEEFGLSSSASSEEIRQAHKRLARLLHPDRSQEEDVRRLAECQMKRLNAIYTVLSDPESRWQYDLSLAASSPEALSQTAYTWFRKTARSVLCRQFLQRNVVWILAGLAGVFAIYSFLAQQPGRGTKALESPVKMAQPGPVTEPGVPLPAGRPISPQAKATPAPQLRVVRQQAYEALEREATALRRALEKAQAEHKSALAQVAQLQAKLYEERQPTDTQGIQPVRPPEPPPETAAAVAGVAPPAPPSPATGKRGLTGTWFYVPPSLGSTPQDLYPPEYIEAVIVEENSYVRGRYRGRYQVGDRAISPEVVFGFEGQVNSPGRYQWTGHGSAKGEVHLKLVSENSLSVAWFASHLSRQMGLGSGTAILVRRDDP